MNVANNKNGQLTVIQKRPYQISLPFGEGFITYDEYESSLLALKQLRLHYWTERMKKELSIEVCLKLLVSNQKQILSNSQWHQVRQTDRRRNRQTNVILSVCT